MSRHAKNAAMVLAAALTASMMAGCGASSDSPDTGLDAEPSQATSPTQAGALGTAQLSSAEGTEAFTLDECVSTSAKSLSASGKSAGHALNVDVEAGTGDIIVADLSDITSTSDGSTHDLAVASDGTFSASGTYPSGGTEVAFTITGTCTTLTWS